MNRFLGHPPPTGGTERAVDRPIRGAFAALVVILVVLGSGSFWALASGGPGAPSAGPSAPLATEALPPTHGDLVVLPGETYTIQPTATSHTYYQGGNITVDAGGTLNVVNVSLTFVEFVASAGTAYSRLSHIYHFNDAGNLTFHNATLTTDVGILNAYAKLTLSVTGNLTVANSTFAFPGWVDVSGATSLAVFNNSVVRSNGDVLNITEPGDIQADTSYAPILDASAGAHVDFFNSAYRNVYANDFLVNGVPTPAPLYTTKHFAITPGLQWYNLTDLTTQNDSANLTRDWAYPAGISGATVNVLYNNKVNLSSSATAYVALDGKNYSFGQIDFGPGPLAGALAIGNASSAFVSALNSAGLLNYLNWTGAFNAGPLKIEISFRNVSGGASINITEAWLTLLPNLSFNLLATGAGTTLTVVNSRFDLTWNNLPSGTFSLLSPYPWLSNKLVLTDGATAYLANLTAVSTIPSVFSASVVLPDATSQAYFYRWAQFNITGRGGALPIVGAQATAYYAYNKNQSNNATANALNDLAVANPAMWKYVEYWDGSHGIPGYGMTGRTGKANLLLAVGNLTGPTLPDGYFLGGYHVGVTIPIAGPNTEWFNWSLQPYPGGVANGTPNYGGPDHGPNVTFDAYFSSLTVGTIVVTQNGTQVSTIAPARLLGIDVPLTNTGTAEIYNLSGTLYYGNTVNGTPVGTVPFHNVTLIPGATSWMNFTWYVTSAITGIYGSPNQLFATNISYNLGIPTLGGGFLTPSTRIDVSPYYGSLSVSSVTLEANGAALPGNTVRIGQTLDMKVVLNYSGTYTLPGYSAELYYNPPNVTSLPLLEKNVTGLHLNNTGQQTTVWLNWTVVDTVVGLEKKAFLHNFTLSFGWDYFVDNFGIQVLVVNDTGAIAPTMIAPSEVVITYMSLPPSTLSLSQSYASAAGVRYNGSQEALIELYAVPYGQTGGGYLIATTDTYSGNFSFAWISLSGVLSAGSKYSLSLEATYNGVTAYYNLTGPFSVPSSSSSPGFFFQTFLGLPLWMWLAIVGAVIVAIVLVLFVSRRQAAGKLVECGECGNLIPEDATVCPKCGAEFESDLIRCSRCASTIPANSQYCPECAAQLLGKPGEGEADPERQGYADFTERYRAEAKKELGENYNEGSFWDWWKRQPTYTSFSQWKLQQGQGAPSRAGMSAPPAGTVTAAPAAGAPPPTGRPPAGGGVPPPKGGAGGAAAAAPAAAVAGAPPAPPPAPPAGTLKPCPTCGKEIPPEYLVCPFCGSVTQ